MYNIPVHMHVHVIVVCILAYIHVEYMSIIIILFVYPPISETRLPREASDDEEVDVFLRQEE